MKHLSMTDREELKGLAIAASPLPWETDASEVPHRMLADFRAAATPAAVLDLLKQLEVAEAAVALKVTSAFHPAAITVVSAPGLSREGMDNLKRLMGVTGRDDQLIVIMRGDMTIESMSDEDMRSLGWVRVGAAASRDE